MKLPPLKRLRKEEFSGVEWIDNLIIPLNQFMETVTATLNKNITLSQNMRGEIRDIDFIFNPSVLPLRVSWPFRAQPTDIIVTRLIGGVQTAAVGVRWSFTEGTVLIDEIFGINTGHRYKMRLFISSN